MERADSDQFVLHSSTVTVGAPILLTDPRTIWTVETGSVALFLVQVKGGAPSGTRRYLCTSGPGDVLFGFSSSAETGRRSFLAAPLEQTSLRKMSLDSFGTFAAVAPAASAALVDRCISGLGAALSGSDRPAGPVSETDARRFSLNSGQALQLSPGTIGWVQLHRGEANWMGMEGLTITATSDVIALGPGIWLEATSPVEGSVVSSAVLLQNPEGLFDAVERLHDQFLACIDRLDHQKAVDRLARHRRREQLNERMLDGAMRALVSAVKPRGAAAELPEGAPLFIAVHAIARALGINDPGRGTSMSVESGPNSLAACEQAFGIRMRKVVLRGEWWRRDGGPLLGFLGDARLPVALLARSGTSHEIFNPASMARTPVDAQTAAGLSPLAYMPYRPLPDSAATPAALIKFGLRGHGRDLVVIILVGFAGTLLGMLTPLATAVLIDTAIPDADRRLLWQLALGLLAAAIGRAMFELVQSFAILRLETSSTAETQAAIWDKLLKVKASFFHRYTTGDLVSRVAAIGEIRQKLGATTTYSLVVGLISVLNLLLMLYYSVRLTVVAAAVALLVVLVTTVSGLLTLRKLRPLQTMEGQTFGLAVQLINGITKLRVAGAERSAFALWARQYGKQQALHRGIQRIADSVTVFNQTLPTLASALIFWFAAIEAGTAGAGRMTIGIFLAFNSAFGALMGGASALSNTAIDAISVLNLWARAKPILQAEPEMSAGKTTPGKLSGALALEHVTFRYREDGPLVLDDISLHADSGEFIGIVGPSGSGKSTILKLLLGFETPHAGAVYYEGQDLSGLDLYAVRRQLGVVLQNSKVLSASIFDNISAGARIGLDDAWEAARSAGLAEDIEEMPMGMYTYVSEGATNLAGGQRQRLLIARALALKPRVLLFDEATSALDNTKQAIVNESLEHLRVTRVVVAHRLSTIANANRIYVIDSGRVVQCGAFADLAHEEGVFARLMARQLA